MSWDTCICESKQAGKRKRSVTVASRAVFYKQSNAPATGLLYIEGAFAVHIPTNQSHIVLTAYSNKKWAYDPSSFDCCWNTEESYVCVMTVKTEYSSLCFNAVLSQKKTTV